MLNDYGVIYEDLEKYDYPNMNLSRQRTLHKNL